MAIISEEMLSVWELMLLLHVGSCNHHYDLRTLLRGLICYILSENTSLFNPSRPSVHSNGHHFSLVFYHSVLPSLKGELDWMLPSQSMSHFFFFKESLKWTVWSCCMQKWYAEYNMLHVIHKSNGHICCPWNTIWVWKGLKIIIRYSHWSYLTAGMSLICKLRYKLFITEWILNYTMLYRCLIAVFV